jgi:hypothetical protein
VTIEQETSGRTAKRPRWVPTAAGPDWTGGAARLAEAYYTPSASAREASSIPMSRTSVSAAQASIPTSRAPLRAARARAPRRPDAAQPAAVETHNAPAMRPTTPN